MERDKRKKNRKNPQCVQSFSQQFLLELKFKIKKKKSKKKQEKSFFFTICFESTNFSSKVWNIVATGD